MSWTTKGGFAFHSVTGATSMREHREIKRKQAETRNANTPEEKRAARWKGLMQSVGDSGVDAAADRARPKRARRHPHRKGPGAPQATALTGGGEATEGSS
jgi:hypothetical protein